MDCHENELPMLLCHCCDQITNQFSRMDFKHKTPPPNGNYPENIYRSPYNNESMLHHINSMPKENYKQHMSVYDYSHSNGQQKNVQNMFVNRHYSHRSPTSVRLRRRCRSECLSPVRSPQYHERFSNSPKNGHNQVNNGYYHNMWPVHQRSIEQEQQTNNYEYQNQQSQQQQQQQHHPMQQHDIQGINGYKYRFDNLLVDGKSVHIETIDANDEVNYLSWNERRRRARSESASQDFYYREIYYDDLQGVKRTREILKEKKSSSSSHRNHVTNPKNNFSVLVNNSNHYRYSPKMKIRSHHISHKSGLIRVSSPLHKARLQMWKSQSHSGSSSVQSTESNGDVESSQSQSQQQQQDDDDIEDEEEDEDPPILYGPGNQLIDDDMTDPEDNYESSLSISSSERSIAQHNTRNPTAINTDCVQGGRVLHGPMAASLFPFVPPFITFASFEEKGPELPAAIHKILKWKLTTITPLLVRKVLVNTGFRLMKTMENDKPSDAKFESLSEPNDWVGTWGKHMKSPCFKTLHSYQKFNHLPGSFQIGRKDRCWRNLQTLMSRHGKKEFGFMPRTFIIPQDLNMLRQTWHKYSQKNTKWIIKPPASARGTGIRVVNSWSQIPKRKPLIVQRYIERPLLINGSKFDLRLYVLVTSLNPLRVYLHTDGLARFASVKYSERTETLNDRYMHLTNYSINKLSTSYDKNDDANACKGMKWTIKSLWSYLQQRGINTDRLWGALRNLVLRTILAGEGPINSMMKTNLQNKYNAFELFGIDVLLDSELVPWLLEVNISPSLHSASGLDMAVKGPLVTALLNTAMYQIPPKIPMALQGELSKELNVKMPLCYDKRIYVTTLSKEERQKHHHFTQKTILREDYLSTILENLTPDDLRCLIITEDELNRCHPLERIFPAPNSYKYLNFTDQPRYYNHLIDAWEHRYCKKRDSGIALLRTLCYKRMHLKVPPTTIQKDCDDNKNLDKIAEVESSEETVISMSVDANPETVVETTKGSCESTAGTDTTTDDIEIDSNENKDTSNLADIQSTASPKKDISENGKCFSSIMNCLPITSDSEIILVKQ